MNNKMKEQKSKQNEKGLKSENKMRDIRIEKLILSCGALAEELDKAAKLLKTITGMEPCKTKAKKRIPGFAIRPGLEIGCMVTVRKDKIKALLKKLLEAKDNKLKEKQIADNHFSFGIDEYIEIPDIEYDREIGIRGLDVTVVFARKGLKTKLKKIKKGKLPKKQIVTKKEIIDYMKKNYNLEVEGK